MKLLNESSKSQVPSANGRTAVQRQIFLLAGALVQSRLCRGTHAVLLLVIWRCWIASPGLAYTDCHSKGGGSVADACRHSMPPPWYLGLSPDHPYITHTHPDNVLSPISYLPCPYYAQPRKRLKPLKATPCRSVRSSTSDTHHRRADVNSTWYCSASLARQRGDTSIRTRHAPPRVWRVPGPW